MEILQEASRVHAAGRLVPFLGSGMSVGVCRSWTGMVRALEESVGLPLPKNGGRGSGGLELVRRAALALDVARRGLGRSTADAVRDVLLERGPAPPTRQMQ